MLPEHAEFCPECGAPVDRDPAPLQGSDAAVYPELARANLFRMRGEYRKAEEVCIGILRKYPNQATANTLLGDISAEKGDLQQAAQWYELALEISPGSESESKKLKEVRRRIKEHELASSAANLGIPTTKSPIGLYVGGVVLLIAAVALAAFLLGQKTPQTTLSNSAEPSLKLPVVVGSNSPTTASTGGASPEKPGREGSTNSTQTPPNELVAALATKSGEGSKVFDAWIDKRTSRVFVSIKLGESDDPKMIASSIAMATFGHVPECPKVTVRGFTGADETYEADAMRTAYDEVMKRDWQAQNGTDPAKIAAALVINEWRAGAVPPAPEGTGSTGNVAGAPPPDGL
jgi:hypothetical protein